MKQITTAPVMADPKLGLRWGLGWGIEPGQNNDYIWRWGNNGGYRAFVIAFVRSGDGFFMLTNSEAGQKLAQPLA
jgi:hypothetical protein